MNELKHKSAGLGLESDAEYCQIDGHEADGQTEGDVLAFLGGYWKRIPLDELCEDYASELLEAIGVQDVIDASIVTHSAATDPHGDRAYSDGELGTHETDTTTHGATGAVVGTTNEQTLTLKTLTAPVIATFYQNAGKTLLLTAPATTGTIALTSQLHTQNADTDLDATFEATFVKKVDYTAKGATLVASATSTPAVVAVSGNDGYVLTEDAASPSGVKWAETSGGMDKGIIFPATAEHGDALYRTDLSRLYLCKEDY